MSRVKQESSDILKAWQQIIRELIAICDSLCDRLAKRIDGDPPATFIYAFVIKATQTLKGISLLYDNGLSEQAQALVRMLFEARVNFDCFLKLLDKNARSACQRILDSMTLEKVKQQRATNFRGLDLIPGAPTRKQLEEQEAEVASRYSPTDLQNLRRYGFTGESIEKRAESLGLHDLYNVVYRNFSRNIHSTDYAELLMIQKHGKAQDFSDYYRSRGHVGCNVAVLSAGRIAVSANRIYRCGLHRALDQIGKKRDVLYSKVE